MQSSKMSKTLARYPVLLPRKYLQPYTSLRIFNSYLQDFCNLCVLGGGEVHKSSSQDPAAPQELVSC